jgi:DNA-binding transcriptional LysR family regulator
VFEIRGRKAVLTEAGQVLYRRARTLLEEAAMLERGAAAMSQEWQPEIAIAVEIIFPTWLLLECLAEFAKERPETRIEVYETVLAGTSELLAQGRVDFAIGSERAGVAGEVLMAIEAVAVAHPDHPLHRLGRKITERDLRAHRRILIRDTAVQREKEVSGVELRWTVGNKATAIRALAMGLGYSWVVEDTIREELAGGTLKPLPLAHGARRRGELFLAFADPEFPGRDAARLADIVRGKVADTCAKQKKRARA